MSHWDAAVRAVGRLPTLSRDAVRARFDQRFTARRMARDHVALYQRLARGTAPRIAAIAAE